MYVDIWIFCLFSILFGACAVWNRMRGVTQGIEATLEKLETDKIIEVIGDQVVPYRRDIRRRRKKTA